MPVPIIYSDRLILREIRVDDADFIFEYKSNPKNSLFTSNKIHNSKEDTYKFIENMNNGVEKQDWLVWMIELKLTHEPIGIISLWNFNHFEESAEIGYDLFPKHRGNGYAKEAVNEMCDIALIDLNLRFVDACTSYENIASIKMLKNNGFVHVHTFVDTWVDGTKMETHTYRKPRKIN